MKFEIKSTNMVRMPIVLRTLREAHPAEKFRGMLREIFPTANAAVVEKLVAGDYEVTFEQDIIVTTNATDYGFDEMVGLIFDEVRITTGDAGVTISIGTACGRRFEFNAGGGFTAYAASTGPEHCRGRAIERVTVTEMQHMAVTTRISLHLSDADTPLAIFVEPVENEHPEIEFKEVE